MGGHVSVGPVVIYGWNAMHGAVNVRWFGGWFCFKVPTKCFGVWWPAYCYWSPDGTPCGERVRWFWRPKKAV